MIERSGIYIISSSSTNKVYVGSATNISKRWSAHRKQLRTEVHRNIHLQLAWNKHGEEDFVFRVLEFCTKDNLDNREQHWMDYYDATNNKLGYNLAPTARSSRGRKWTDLERSLRLPKMTTDPMNTPEVVARRIKTLRANGVHNKKLDWVKVCEIRELYAKYGTYQRKATDTDNVDCLTVQQLADKYNVGLVTIHNVLTYATWKTEPEKREELILINKELI